MWVNIRVRREMRIGRWVGVGAPRVVGRVKKSF